MSTRTSSKSANARLFVATVGLMAAILDLLAGAVRLGAAAVRYAAVSLERAANRAAVTRARVLPPEPARAIQALSRAIQAPAGPAVEASDPKREEDLRGALAGLGYQAGRVRAFTAGCRGRTEGLDVLIREGIQKLSAN